jgi:hypothetical protein
VTQRCCEQLVLKQAHELLSLLLVFDWQRRACNLLSQAATDSKRFRLPPLPLNLPILPSPCSKSPQESGIAGYEQLYNDSMRRALKLQQLAQRPPEGATFRPRVRTAWQRAGLGRRTAGSQRVAGVHRRVTCMLMHKGICRGSLAHVWASVGATM